RPSRVVGLPPWRRWRLRWAGSGGALRGDGGGFGFAVDALAVPGLGVLHEAAVQGVDAGGAELAHGQGEFTVEDVEHAQHALLPRGGVAIAPGAPDGDQVRADGQRLDDVVAGAHAGAEDDGHPVPDRTA